MVELCGGWGNMKRIWSGIAAAILFFALAAPAWARNEEENWDRCLQQDIVGPLEPADVIEACRFVLRMTLIPPNVRNDAFNNIGVQYMHLGQFSEAISAFSEALRKLRDLPDMPTVRQLANNTRINRARAYVAAKRYDDALHDYDAAVASEPLPKYRAQRCLAHALYDDNFASALPDCQKAIEADRNVDYAYAGWFTVEYREGKFADVVADCELAQRTAYVPPEAEYVCALARIRLGNTAWRERLRGVDLSLLEHGERFRELGMVP